MALLIVAFLLPVGFFGLAASQDGGVILIVSRDQGETASLNPTRLQVAAGLALSDYLENRGNPGHIEHHYIFYAGDEGEGYARAKAYLAENPGVMVLVGDINSPGTELLAALAEEQQVPHVSFFATDEEIFTGRPWSFSYRPRVGQELDKMLEFLGESLGAQDVIIIASQQVNLLPRAEKFRDAVEGSKGKEINLVDYIIYEQDMKDFRQEIARLARHNREYDTLVLFLTAFQLEHFLQQLAQAGLDKTVLTSGIIIHPELLPVFKGVDDSLYTIVPQLFFQLERDTLLKCFVNRYMVVAGFHRIDSLGPWIYDGFWTLHEALEGAGSRQELREALKSYDRERFVGCVCFDEEGLLKKNPFVPVRIRNGHFEEVLFP